MGTRTWLAIFTFLLGALAGCADSQLGDGDPLCGNGILEVGEACDDGNVSPADGCSASCVPENGTLCGNGAVDPGESCDDGNTNPGDGCDASCAEEVCGDGTVSGTEECDDGNLEPDDGCDASCASECGNDLRQGAEECDDGNRDDNDGCSATCVFEAGVCGDGVLNSTEQCDDGNTTPGDGCDGNCKLEGSECGNGIMDAGEGCDDGNTTPGDGCDASCQSEGGVCTAGLEIGCGVSDVWSTLNVGSTDAVDSYSCTSFNESGREYAYRFAPTVDTTMSISLTPQVGVDLDLLLLGDDGNGLCESGDCAIYADSSVQATFPGGGEYWIVVDGYNGAEGSYSIDFDCPTDGPSCPDGQGNNGESCADVYQGADIWRCTVSPALNNATVSQVCRDSGNGPVWTTFHVNPTECCACAGDFDVGCCAANSGSAGCP